MLIFPSPIRKKRTGSDDAVLRQGKSMSSETAINKDRFRSERREAAMLDEIMQNYNRLPGDMQERQFKG
jgi:hypothetical protein